MSLVARGQVKHIATSAMSAGQVVAAVAGGALGFIGGDYIGISTLINSLWDSAGIETIVPALANAQPMIVALVAAGIAIGIGYAVLRFDGAGIIGLIAKFIGWGFIGIGAKEAINGLSGGLKLIKTVK